MFPSHANIIKSDLVLLIGGIELDSFFFSLFNLTMNRFHDILVHDASYVCIKCLGVWKSKPNRNRS